MSAPTSLDEFLACLRKSNLLDVLQLDEYLEAARAAGTAPRSPGRLAKELVRDGFLTNYQAEQLLAGRYRNFFISGKYKVLERLGSGGMASVYLCEHKVMQRPVALKVLPSIGGDDPSTLARFHREARAVAQLHHPNIVGAHDIDQYGKLHFLVMEYIDGTDLEDFVAFHGRMDPLRAANYVRQAAQGLQHAHEAGLVHRDIKPSNLLVDRSGTVKVLDLGLARFAQDDADLLTQRSDREVMLGTLDYMAPEQVRDSHDVDIRADIYSLGATFYYLLTARGLFGEATPAQKLAAHQYSQPVPIRGLRADLPEGLAQIVDRMLEKDRALRYQTPAEVVEALDPWTREPIPPPSLSDSPRLSPAALSAIRKRSEPLTSTRAESALEASGLSLSLIIPPAGSALAKSRLEGSRSEHEAAPMLPPGGRVASRGRFPWVAVVVTSSVLAGVGGWWAASRSRPGPTGLNPAAAPDRNTAPRVVVRPEATRPIILWKAPDAMARSADLLAIAGRWDEATAELATAVALRPEDFEAHYRLAISRLGAGDLAGYRRACATMFERFGTSRNPAAVDRLLYTCVPVPDALPPANRMFLVPLAEFTLGTFANNERLVGAACYRDGRFDEGLRRFGTSQARGHSNVAWDWLFLAMLHARLNHRQEARQCLGKGRCWIALAERMQPAPDGQMPMYHHWCERAEVLALLQEADALISDVPAP